MTKAKKKNIFDNLIIIITFIFVIAFVFSLSPLMVGDFSVETLKQRLIFTVSMLILVIILKLLAGQFIWITNLFNSLDTLQIVLISSFVVLILIYNFLGKDKEYLGLAKYIIATFIGAFAQKTIPFKAKKD